MTLLYIMSIPKDFCFCPKPSTKPINSFNLVQAYLSIKFYFSRSQLAMSTILEKENRTINQFYLYKEKNTNNLPTYLSKAYIMYSHITYIKKKKLVTIIYTKNFQKVKLNKSIEMITKYCVTTNLKITIVIFQD